MPAADRHPRPDAGSCADARPQVAQGSPRTLQGARGWGLGARWLPLLTRVRAVPKAAFSAASERPAVETHCGSMAAVADLAAGELVVVVDDVVTRGATMLGAIARLREALPRADVRGFALLRTMSPEAIHAVKQPCSGVVRRVSWGTQREP
jgi:hypothetical protein